MLESRLWACGRQASSDDGAPPQNSMALGRRLKRERHERSSEGESSRPWRRRGAAAPRHGGWGETNGVSPRRCGVRGVQKRFGARIDWENLTEGRYGGGIACSPGDGGLVRGKTETLRTGGSPPRLRWALTITTVTAAGKSAPSLNARSCGARRYLRRRLPPAASREAPAWRDTAPPRR